MSIVPCILSVVVSTWSNLGSLPRFSPHRRLINALDFSFSSFRRLAFPYPPAASPDNAHKFQRVPFDRRVHWLRLWNPKNDPENVDCGLAFATWRYCNSVTTQLTHKYDTGNFRDCRPDYRDMKLCMRVKGLAYSAPERAREMLAQRESVETEHVFEFRATPPATFMKGMIDETTRASSDSATIATELPPK